MTTINNSVISNNFSSKTTSETTAPNSHRETLASKSQSNAGEIKQCLANAGLVTTNVKINHDEMGKISSREQFDSLRMDKYNNKIPQDGYDIINNGTITSTHDVKIRNDKESSFKRSHAEIHAPNGNGNLSSYETFSLQTSRDKKTNLLIPKDAHDKYLQRMTGHGDSHKKTEISGMQQKKSSPSGDDVNAQNDTSIAGINKRQENYGLKIEDGIATAVSTPFPHYVELREVDLLHINSKNEFNAFIDMQFEKMQSHYPGNLTIADKYITKSKDHVYTHAICNVEKEDGSKVSAKIAVAVPRSTYDEFNPTNEAPEHLENITKGQNGNNIDESANTKGISNKTHIEVSTSSSKKYGYLAAIITAAIGAIGAGVTAIVSHAKNAEVENDDNYTQQGDDAADAAVSERVASDNDAYADALASGNTEKSDAIAKDYNMDQNGRPIIDESNLNDETKASIRDTARAEGIENAKVIAREQVQAGTAAGWGASAGLMGLGGLIAGVVKYKNHNARGKNDALPKGNEMMNTEMRTTRKINILSSI